MSQTITCPHCREPIELTAALTHSLKEDIRKEYEAEKARLIKQKDQEILQEKKLMWEKAQKAAREKAQEEFRKKETELTREVKEELAEKSKKLEEYRKVELELRREKRALEEEKKEIELSVARRLDKERARLEEEAVKKLQEEYRLRDKEKEKKLIDALKANEELRRKLQQGSQQTQGDVLEHELAGKLSSEFPRDHIKDVPTGIRGADIIQEIYDMRGRACGAILWESKRTKAWTDSWLAKLKNDQRAVKAEIAIIVTQTLPSDIENFGFKNGVWVTNYESVLGVASALRAGLIQLAGARQAHIGTSKKMEILYQYLSGTEFRHRIEAIVEAFGVMREDLERERRLFTKQWAKREKQITQVIESTVGMHGELHAIMGASLPEIKSLTLTSGESEE